MGSGASAAKVSLKKGPVKCREHDKEVVAYCSECQRKSCKECNESCTANGHSLVLIESYAIERCREIQDEIKKDRLSKCQTLQRKVDEFNESYSKSVDIEILNAESHRKLLKNLVDKLANDAISHLKKQKSDSKSYCKSLSQDLADMKEEMQSMTEEEIPHAQEAKDMDTLVKIVDYYEQMDIPEFKSRDHMKMDKILDIEDMLKKAFGIKTELIHT